MLHPASASAPGPPKPTKPRRRGFWDGPRGTDSAHMVWESVRCARAELGFLLPPIAHRSAILRV